MKHNVYSIFDAAAEAYFPPFFLHTEGMAIRGFTDAVNDPESQVGKHPKDYTLFQIGTFDDNTGIITPLQTNKPLGNGLHFVVKSDNPDQPSLLKEA